MANTVIFLVYSIIMTLRFMANSLSMDLIPIHSILPEHFDAQERHEYLVNISLSRKHYFGKSNSTLSSNSLEAPLSGPHNRLGYFITPILIEFESYKTYALVDTGSHKTWIQCEGCQDCFEFGGKKFDYKRSPNFEMLSPSDPMCINPDKTYEGACGFEDTYYSNQYIKGFYGRENFYLQDSKTHMYRIYKGLVFGCAMITKAVEIGNGPTNPISGLFGLSSDKRSFISQLDSQVHGRFSYCIPPFDHTRVGVSTMYFGDDAQIRGDATRQVKTILMDSRYHYNVFVNGISVDGIRLPIDPSVFQVDGLYGKGFEIDSGSPYSTIDKRAYNVLVYYVSRYFSQNYDWQPIPLQQSNAEVLCYMRSYPDDDSVFPLIAFHFRGKRRGEEVDMVLNHKNMFQSMKNPERFCMMVYPSNESGLSIFGAFQQTNFKYLFDIYNNLLSFVSQTCLEN
ncbi:hypothetical protein vseg_009934 [Gypsophila vaccaria]